MGGGIVLEDTSPELLPDHVAVKAEYLRELEEDKERLDWFSHHHGTRHSLGDVTWCTHSIDVPQFMTLSEAIDKARSSNDT